MGAQTAPLGLRLFLEGVEVPVIAADVNIQPGQPAQASIQIIPTDSALLMLPRTCVHLFFLDRRSNAIDLDPESGKELAENTSLGRGDLPDSRYKVLFIGEVIGYNYTKNAQSRSLVLQCLDLSSYWDACYQWFADYSVNGNFTDRTHHFVGSNQFLFNNVSSGTKWVVGNIINSKPENPRYANIPRGLLAGYIHLLEAISGIRPKGRDFNGFRGANDFFSIAELRYKLTSMIGAAPNDKTAARMYQVKAFNNWLRNGMGSAGALVSFRDVLRLVGQYIYHETYPNPCAYYQPANGSTTTVVIPRSVKKSKLGKKASKLLKTVPNRIQDIIEVLREPEGEDINRQRNTLVAVLTDVSKAKLLIEGSNAQNAARFAVLLQQAQSGITSVASKLLPRLRGLDKSTGIKLANELVEARNIVDDLNSNATKVVPVAPEVKEIPATEFLFNQLILPETYFVPPPKCNVIFPDMYQSLAYSRNFLREVSRLALHAGFGITENRGLSKLLGHHYFAPNIQDVRGEIARKTIFTAGNTIMPHEVHTGIVPKFEWVTDGHRWGIKAARAANETTRNARISYIQRLANFQFFLHRWGARTMQLNGRFMPQLVLGFPAVVMDRGTASPAALSAIADTLGTGKSVFPTAYIGKVARLSHSVSQDGGITNVQFQFARTHRSFDDEFLGVIQREKNTTQAISIDVAFDTMEQRLLSGTGVGSLEARLARLYFAGELKEGKQVDSRRVITSVKEGRGDEDTAISRRVARLLGVPDSIFDLYTTRGNSFANAETGELDALVPNFVLVGIDVEFLTDRGSKVAGATPPEIALKPGWYDEIWNPVKRSGSGEIESFPISDQVYQPLLGTFAITDDQFLLTEIQELLRAYTREAGDERAIELKETPDGSAVLTIDGKEIATFDANEETVEKSIDSLTILYGLIRAKGLPVGDFVSDFTSRPIASLVDILGESDLVFDDSGAVVPREDGDEPVEGFHSRAFGDYNTDVEFPVGDGDPKPGRNALQLLLEDGQEEGYVSTIFNKSDTAKQSTIPKYLDPRGRAQERVRAYVAELSVTRGLLGA